MSEKLSPGYYRGLVQPPSIFNMKRNTDQGVVMPTSRNEELPLHEGKFLLLINNLKCRETNKTRTALVRGR